MKIPQEFIDTINSYNCPSLSGLPEALSETSPSISVRVNRYKGVILPGNIDKVPWCERGLYLPERLQFTFDPAMHQGLYYVQDASSMIMSHIIAELTKGASLPVTYLDACAAPGGKTTAAIDALPEGSLVVANEYIPARASILRENLIKWGNPSCVITKGDTARFRKLHGFFDIIATDVPCSGEGMFRKDVDAVDQWSRNLVTECAARQLSIIENLWGALKPGGYLIYSTCTFNRDENEEIIDYINANYEAESIDMHFPHEWNISEGINTPHHCYRFLPHKTRGEGLFIAVMRKSLDAISATKPGKVKKANKVGQMEKCASQWLLQPEDFDVYVAGDNITAFPKSHKKEFDLLATYLEVIHHGITLCTIKGKDLIPSQSLAMSTALNRNAFVSCDVDYDTAIAYLRREAITIDDAPRGYVLLTYNSRPLGFVKNLGNRANNLYPPEWRILSTHQPKCRVAMPYINSL